MGYFVHHAIVVIGTHERVAKLWHYAREVGAQVSPILDSSMNGTESFFVAPDGSKEGWEDSAKGNVRRSQIIARARESYLMWAEVEFPEDGAARVSASFRDEDGDDT